MSGLPEPAAAIRWGTPAARWVVAATVLGSGLAFLDATSSNVALPAIGEDLGAEVSGLQWTVNAYTLTLASLILLGGSLGDRFGRRRVFVGGTLWFAAASVLCGVATNAPMLVGARALQGVGGALLTPGSLAILQSSFAPGDRGRAVGAWSGLSGIAAAMGPLVGGWLVDVWSWRLIYFTNLPVAAAVVLVAVRHVPESGDPGEAPGLDVAGAVLAAAGLGAVTWALIDAGERGPSPAVLAGALAGIAALVALWVVERRSRHPMLPPAIFASRQFTAANLVTFAVYASLGGMFFLLFAHLQIVVGYSPVESGLAALPITGLMLVLSTPAGHLAERIGPRVPMSVGPLLLAGGLALMTRISAEGTYLGSVFPAVALFGLGLSLTVAPLTATVLAAADPRHVGAASGVNNAISRGAGLLAVAVLPGLAGLSGEAYLDPAVFAAGFRVAMLLAAGVAAAGGLVGWLLITNHPADDRDPCPSSQLDRQRHCPVDGAPLATARDAESVGAQR